MHDAGFSVGFFDRLDPDAGIDEFPVLLLRSGVEFMQYTHAVAHTLGALLHHVSHEIEVAPADLDQGHQIVRFDRKR